MTVTVRGADLHPGSIVVDATGPHTIDHLRPHPGRRFVGDTARRAFESPDETGWRCTVMDGERFKVEEED